MGQIQGMMEKTFLSSFCLEGHYMLIDSYEDLPTNTRAVIISPLISPSTNTRCFKFWYFMDGRNTNFLNFFLVPYGYTQSNDPNTQLYGNMGSQWLEGQMTVPSSARSFYVSSSLILDHLNSNTLTANTFQFSRFYCNMIEKTLYKNISSGQYELPLVYCL